MEKKISAEEYFDDLAQEYECEGVSVALEVGHLVEAKRIFAKYNHKEGSILDLGCGTGLLSEALAGSFEFTGIDISKTMLESAAKRGYTTIHKSLDVGLSEQEDQSYDFVTCLTALLCIENIQPILKDMRRVARKGVLITLEEITDDFIEDFPAVSYDHTHMNFPEATEDYRVLGWQTPTRNTDIYVRMIYIEKEK